MKAKELARLVLMLILGPYFIGWLGIQYAGVTPNADFLGRYFHDCQLWVGKRLIAQIDSDGSNRPLMDNHSSLLTLFEVNTPSYLIWIITTCDQLISNLLISN